MKNDLSLKSTINSAGKFQVFAKPVGALCNLGCRYCYYRTEGQPGPLRASDDLMESYIIQHIAACNDPVIAFSWHGGEPTLYGLEGFRRIVALQKRHCPGDRVIVNGIQTNGLLIDEEWSRFLAQENFSVGLSLDGPQPLHDLHRVTVRGDPTHNRVLRARDFLLKQGARTECLCVVHSENVQYPEKIYDFFESLDVPFLTFLPLVEPLGHGNVSRRTVSSPAWGEFLCKVFDLWIERGIGRTKIQIFEEAARSAFELEHTLCIFRKTCGGVPVLEANGDVYSCDHFVTAEYRLGNIRDTPLAELLESPRQQAFGRAKLETLPRQCLECRVRDMCNGGCPKNRCIAAYDGEPGLNYLCAGYKRFFTHCLPFVRTLAQIWGEQGRS
jgi:uncharacterized protein